ncbi:viscotoxin-A3 [Anaerotardibacter muris]|uniref:viscotoxin-A3 n=1 Tax=Anaerotardibacter muris TaxID=2941505 RepID=UPI002042699D|nr:viscotoxin-A3 [Anaerotardibacter muris]
MKKEEKKEKSYREELMKGLLPINLGALFMPPIWGPANGIWITILYYPLWLFADNLFYEALMNPTTLSVVFAIVVAVLLAVVTIVFARVSQGYACERAINMGKTKEWYIKRQRVWAVAMGILAVVMIAAATYYNLVIRPGMPVA